LKEDEEATEADAVDQLIEDADISNVVKKLEAIKARKEQKWKYFVIYVYAQLVFNLSLDLALVIISDYQF
jgi:hypothetical protein